MLEAEVVSSLPDELQESEKELDAILDADFSDPVKLKIKTSEIKAGSPPYQFYLRVQSHLAEWWDEFSKELDQKNGGPKYKSIQQFARAKSKNVNEQEWIVGMIGTEPKTYNEGRRGNKVKWQVIPWLGDWKARRTNAYWAPEHPAKIKSLVRSLKEKLQGFEAVQSSAPYLVQMMARYTRLGEQVDQVFAGQALDPNAGISEDNKARFYTYLEMQKAVTRVQLRLLHEWWTAHGLSTNGQPVMITQVNQMFQNAGVNPAGIDMSAKDMEAIKLARMLSTHADNFQMPLPKDVVQEKPPVKANGKQVM